MAFIFYDTETTGTDTTFDQILQFAAIKTDDALNVVDRFDIRCRLLPWVVPAPAALLVTGISIDTLIKAPLSHFEMMRQIHAKLTAWSAGGAVFLGWNSVPFDEPLLRQAYYQCLLPAYQTVTSGNGRGDVMRMVQVAASCAPGAIEVARNGGGKPTFKLERVAEANGIVLDNAHEALADTTATLAVARRLKQRAPALWDHLIKNGRKSNVLPLIEDHDVLFLAEYFGCPFNSVVTPITTGEGDRTALAVFDLKFDPAELFGQTPQALVEVLAASPKRIRTVRLNKQPALFPMAAMPPHAVRERLPDELYRARAARIRENAAFCDAVRQALGLRYAGEEPSSHVEEQIHDRFASPADTNAMRAFHRADWAERERLIDAFADSRYRELAWRIVGGNCFDLNAAEPSGWRDWQRQRICGDGPWRTVDAALAELVSLRAGATALHSRLDEIEGFLQAFRGEGLRSSAGEDSHCSKDAFV